LVRIEPVATKKVQVGTKIEGDPAEGYEIGDPYVKPIVVEARGARSVIDDITRAIAIINLDGNASSLEEDIKLVALDLNEKPMRFISFSPEFVKVSLPIIKLTGGRILGIRANIEGAPESGYWISKIDLEPTSIVVVGDAEKLKSLDYLETKKIDVSGLSKSREYSIDLNLPKGIEIATSEPKTIKVKIQVTSILSNREIIAGVSYVGLADGLKVTKLDPNVIKVIVTGMFNTLDKLNSDNVVVNLDLSGKKAGSYRIPINNGDISTSPGTSVSSFVPSAVTVRIND
jgi:YbbR domain-containing protein